MLTRPRTRPCPPRRCLVGTAARGSGGGAEAGAQQQRRADQGVGGRRTVCIDLRHDGLHAAGSNARVSQRCQQPAVAACAHSGFFWPIACSTSFSSSASSSPLPSASARAHTFRSSFFALKSDIADGERGAHSSQQRWRAAESALRHCWPPCSSLPARAALPHSSRPCSGSGRRAHFLRLLRFWARVCVWHGVRSATRLLVLVVLQD